MIWWSTEHFTWSPYHAPQRAEQVRGKLLMVGIVIPTKIRPDLLLRQLSYYAGVGCQHPVYVGDSRDPERLGQAAEAVRLQERHTVSHLPLPGLGVFPATSHILFEKHGINIYHQIDQFCEHSVRRNICPSALSGCLSDVSRDCPERGTSRGDESANLIPRT